MRFMPGYRQEMSTEGPFPGEPDRLWTMHVVEWLGMEFVLKMPRAPLECEKPMYGKGTPADDKCFRPFETRMWPECAAKFSADHPVLSDVPLDEQVCPECVAKFGPGGLA